jgi:hypothetical protein
MEKKKCNTFYIIGGGGNETATMTPITSDEITSILNYYFVVQIK